MSDSGKKTSDPHLGTGVHEKAAKAHLAKDPRTARLLQAQNALGNEEVQKRLAQGTATRDQLLGFLCQRLHAIRETQMREVQAAAPKEIRKVWMRISDSHKPEWSKPEPTRWHECARLYDQAAYQLCKGNVAQGAAMVERAMASERKAFDDLTRMVKSEELQAELGFEEPAALQAAASLPNNIGECEEPESLSLVHDILNVTTEVPDIPNRRRTRDPFWTELDEDEDEEGGGAP